MAAKKYLSHASGRIQEVQALVVSVGAADDGKLIALDATGKLDNSVMPTGIGADTAAITASENLAAGDFVNIWNSTGVKARKADASVSGKEAHGFVLSAVTSGAIATVYFEGTNTQVTGKTVGARQYLSAATPGATVEIAPSASGNVVQFLGIATSATTIATEAEDGIILA